MLNREKIYDTAEILQLSSSPDPLCSRDAQQLYEAQVVASFLNTIDTLDTRHPHPHILKLMPAWEKAPDIQIMDQDARGKTKKAYDVEVVTFTPYSAEEGLVKFFHRTKLAPYVAYPDGTLIVCHVNLPVKDPHRMGVNIHEALSNHNFPYSLYLYCNQTPDLLQYTAQIYSDFHESWQ
jgi:hypothetical protein